MKLLNAILALCLLAAPLSAESLMVTVAYDSAADALSVKHAEIIAGEPPAASGIGNLIIAYEFSGKPYSVTRFYMPTANPLDEREAYGGDMEYTLVIPWDGKAEAVSVYDLNSTRFATLSLSGLKNAGDAAGTPPKESLANAAGVKSVSKALSAGMGNSETGSAGAQGQQNKNNAGSAGCFPMAILAIVALAVIARA